MIEQDHYQKRLKELHAERYSFWTFYGPFILILTARFLEKYSHEALIVTLPLMIGIQENTLMPFIGR
jgi:hypothetical protein